MYVWWLIIILFGRVGRPVAANDFRTTLNNIVGHSPTREHYAGTRLTIAVDLIGSEKIETVQPLPNVFWPAGAYSEYSDTCSFFFFLLPTNDYTINAMPGPTAVFVISQSQMVVNQRRAGVKLCRWTKFLLKLYF